MGGPEVCAQERDRTSRAEAPGLRPGSPTREIPRVPAWSMARKRDWLPETLVILAVLVGSLVMCVVVFLRQ